MFKLTGIGILQVMYVYKVTQFIQQFNLSKLKLYLKIVSNIKIIRHVVAEKD